MKLFKILCLVLLIGSCSDAQKSRQQTVVAETIQPDKHWLIFPGQVDKPQIVLVSGDEEYRSEEALPQMAKILSQQHGFNCTVLFAQDPALPGVVDPNYTNNIPGLAQLDHADMMIIFTRFRALPDSQMVHINNYLKTGKPVLGIRTATHAFKFNDIDFESAYLHYGNYYESEDQWHEGFGRLVLGEKWISHHGEHGHQSTRGVPAPGAEDHPILNGIEEGSIWGPTDVYGVRLPLPGDSSPVLLGQVINRAGERDDNDPLLGMRPSDSELSADQNDPMMPIAWTKTYQIPEGKSGKVFATTIGSSTDLLSEGTRRMMVNAVFWLLDKDVPDQAQVDIVGDYQPSRFAFQDDAYWDEKALAIHDLK